MGSVSVRLGPVEVVPEVSEGTLLRGGQGVEKDSLRATHREWVGQESPEVALVQADGNFFGV